jgi:hypothetical protein
MTIKNNKALLPVALLVQHVLLFSSYGFSRLLPIVHMGERSWPLYFFVLDAITLFLLLIAVIQFFRSKAKWWLYWVLIVILLFFPLINVKATFSDLNRRLCRDPKCNSYISGPDLSNIDLKWEN